MIINDLKVDNVLTQNLAYHAKANDRYLTKPLDVGGLWSKNPEMPANGSPL